MKNLTTALMAMLFLCSTSLHAQINHLSDKQLLASIQAPIDTHDISVMLELSDRLRNYGMIDSSLSWIQRSKAEMDKAGIEANLPAYYRRLGVYYELELSELDSAEFLLKQALTSALRLKEHKQVIKAYRSLALYYYYPETMSKVDSCFKLGQEYSQSVGRFGDLYDLLSFRAWFHNLQGNAGMEKEMVASLEVLAEEQNDKVLKARAYRELGNYYWSILDLPNAVFQFIKSANLLDEVGNKALRYDVHVNISSIHDELGEFDKATESTLKAISFLNESEDNPSLPSAYNTLGWNYYHSGDSLKAMAAIKRSIQLHRQHYPVDKNIAYPLGNMGLILTQQQAYDSALVYSKMAVPLFEDLNHVSGVAESYNNIGMAYLGLALIDSAEHYLTMGLELSLEATDAYEARNSHKGLYHVNRAKGKWRDALTQFERYVFLNDSIYSTESISKANQMEKMLSEERDAAIIQALETKDELNEAQLRQQRIIGIGGIFVLIIILFSMVMIFRNWKARKKAYFKLALKHEELVATQKKVMAQSKEIEIQSQEIEQQHTDIIDSINFASRIQQALLKPEEHINERIPPHFILFKPRDIVSGDCYWAAHNEPFLYIAAIDCTGHGVPGAMMSMLGIAFLNEIMAAEHNLEPARLLDLLRDKIIKELAQEASQETSYREGMDMSVVRIDLDSNEMLFAGANNPLWLIRNGEPIVYKGDKQGVSYSDRMSPFTQERIQLEKDDTFYIFSDGYPDQLGGPKGKKLKSSTFRSMLVDIHQRPMSDQKEYLDQQLSSWRGDMEQVDDVCVIGVRI